CLRRWPVVGLRRRWSIGTSWWLRRRGWRRAVRLRTIRRIRFGTSARGRRGRWTIGLRRIRLRGVCTVSLVSWRIRRTVPRLIGRLIGSPIHRRGGFAWGRLLYLRSRSLRWMQLLHFLAIDRLARMCLQYLLSGSERGPRRRGSSLGDDLTR